MLILILNYTVFLILRFGVIFNSTLFMLKSDELASVLSLELLSDSVL
jgi:hypothetical protein